MIIDPKKVTEQKMLLQQTIQAVEQGQVHSLTMFVADTLGNVQIVQSGEPPPTIALAAFKFTMDLVNRAFSRQAPGLVTPPPGSSVQ
jgi:hypothetical protein